MRTLIKRWTAYPIYLRHSLELRRLLKFDLQSRAVANK